MTPPHPDPRSLDGRELSRLVAEQVMGWHQEFDGLNERWVEVDGERVEYIDTWMPTELIMFAFQVVEKMRELGYGVVIQDSCARLPWYVEFDDGHRDGEAKDESLPRALCLAALKATGE